MAEMRHLRRAMALFYPRETLPPPLPLPRCPPVLLWLTIGATTGSPLMVRTLPNLPPPGGVRYLADWPTAVGAAAGAAGAAGGAGVVLELTPVIVVVWQVAGT